LLGRRGDREEGRHARELIVRVVGGGRRRRRVVRRRVGGLDEGRHVFIVRRSIGIVPSFCSRLRLLELREERRRRLLGTRRQGSSRRFSSSSSSVRRRGGDQRRHAFVRIVGILGRSSKRRHPSVRILVVVDFVLLRVERRRRLLSPEAEEGEGKRVRVSSSSSSWRSSYELRDRRKWNDDDSRT